MGCTSCGGSASTIKPIYASKMSRQGRGTTYGVKKKIKPEVAPGTAQAIEVPSDEVSTVEVPGGETNPSTD